MMTLRKRTVNAMKPVDLQAVAVEWANKNLSGRTALPADAGEEAEERYLQQQAAWIEEQAPIAAAAWARRNSLDPDKAVTGDVVTETAYLIAAAIAEASEAQTKIDLNTALRFMTSADDE